MAKTSGLGLASFLLLAVQLVTFLSMSAEVAAQRNQSVPTWVSDAIEFARKNSVGPYELAKAGSVFERAPIAHLTTPFVRAAIAAKSAMSAMKPFATTDLTSDVTSSEIRVTMYPYTLGSVGMNSKVVYQPQHSVVIPKGAVEPIQPLWTKENHADSEYGSFPGSHSEFGALTAAFPPEVLQEGNEIVLVYKTASSNYVGSGATKVTQESKRIKIKQDQIRRWR